MAKTKRGKGLWNVESKGRGTCPICLSTRIKILYIATNSDGEQIKVCKKCEGAPQEKIDNAVNTKTLPFRGKHKKELDKLKVKLSGA